MSDKLNSLNNHPVYTLLGAVAVTIGAMQLIANSRVEAVRDRFEADMSRLRTELAASNEPDDLNLVLVSGGTIRGLYLGGSDLTDAGLEELACLKSLQEIDLQSCYNITDQGIAHLASLTNLRSLNVHDTPTVTGGAINTLRDTFPNLEVIRSEE